MTPQPQRIIWADGTQEWRVDDQLHRTDGPARILADGTKEWWVYNQLHRTDGPAVIHAKGTQAWYVNGQLHRTDGPAWIDADGTKEWWVNNQRHRTDGPAVILANGQQEWWVKGENITAQVLSWQQQQSVTWPPGSGNTSTICIDMGLILCYCWIELEEYETNELPKV